MTSSILQQSHLTSVVPPGLQTSGDDGDKVRAGWGQFFLHSRPAPFLIVPRYAPSFPPFSSLLSRGIRDLPYKFGALAQLCETLPG